MIITVNTDGGSRGNPGKSACAYVMHAEERTYEKGFYLGIMTNNQAEYWGLIKAMEFIARDFEINKCTVKAYADSLLMVNQINGIYKVKNDGLKPLYKRLMGLTGQCRIFSIEHVRRMENDRPDKLLNEILDSEAQA